MQRLSSTVADRLKHRKRFACAANNQFAAGAAFLAFAPCLGAGLRIAILV